MLAMICLCRAPAVPHVASATDFLLVRSSTGQLAVRELTGCVAVGQQHPSLPIWAPMSQEAVNYERMRFKVRELKQAMHCGFIALVGPKMVARFQVIWWLRCTEGLKSTASGVESQGVLALQSCKVAAPGGSRL
jgi:hypothetical protein